MANYFCVNFSKKHFFVGKIFIIGVYVAKIICFLCSKKMTKNLFTENSVELPAEDQLKVRLFNNRKLSSLLDAKRAPVGPVLRYVDRCWAKIRS